MAREMGNLQRALRDRISDLYFNKVILNGYRVLVLQDKKVLEMAA